MAVIKRVRLSEIAELVTKGTTPTTLGYEFQDTGVNFLKIECFSEKGDYIQNKATHISEECHEKLKRSQLKEGDILFSIAGVIGRVAIVTRNMLPANINQALAIIRIKKDDIYLPYVKLILTSPLIKKQFERKKQGVAQLNISLKDINDLEIPLPEIGKQIEYANSFKKVEKLIYTRQYQLQKLDELVKARFVEMFGGIHDSSLYPYVPVKELTHVISGGTPSRDVLEYWRDGTIPWVKTTELQNKIITEVDEHITSKGLAASSAKIVPPNTTLIAMYGQGKTRGMTGYLGISAATNQACACILPSPEINSVYIWKYFELSYDKLRNMAKGGNQPNLNGNMIKNFPVLVPPIKRQEEYVQFVNQVDKSKAVEGLYSSLCL